MTNDSPTTPAPHPKQKLFNLYGLTWEEAQNAIAVAAFEIEAETERRQEIRSKYEELLRRQGFSEEYIKGL